MTTAQFSAQLQQKIHALCAYIESHTDEKLTLDILSRQVHISPHYLQRTFKAVIGLTPRQYLKNCRVKMLKHELRKSARVTDAIYQAGFGSGSRVYEQSHSQLGMTPMQYRRGGAGLELSYASSCTALGWLMIAASDRGICFIQFGDNSKALLHRLQAEYPRATLQPMQKVSVQFATWMHTLDEFLTGQSAMPGFQLDLAGIQGTMFQMKVWNYLQQIPCGQVKTYTEVAQAIGQPGAVRAVAGACAANRVALLIPCHRVIRGDGGMGGYKWGLERKHTLLKLENTARQ